MTTQRIESELEALKQQYTSEIKALEERYQRRTKELIGDTKVKLADALTAALNIFNTIPSNYRKEVLKDAAISGMFKSFSATPVKAKVRATSSTSRSNVSDDDVLFYLENERTTGEVKEKFGWTAPTVKNRLDKLKLDGKITMRPDKRRKFWKKA
jgi:hypothetical protein